MEEIIVQSLFILITLFLYWIGYKAVLYSYQINDKGRSFEKKHTDKKIIEKRAKRLIKNYNKRDKILFLISLFLMIPIILFFIFEKIPSIESVKLFSILGVLLVFFGKFKLLNIERNIRFAGWIATGGEDSVHSFILLCGMITLTISILFWL
jgi:di/tricarboxylate transporter